MSAKLHALDCALRPMVEADVPLHGAMLKRSFNQWYWNHGAGKDHFTCDDRDMTIFAEIYRRISPGHCVVAADPETGAMMGACFYHPRERHVSLGIMAVDSKYFGRGVGGRLIKHIVEFTESHGYDALRLVGSACNMDSFSLYNRAGFVPRVVHQDMVLAVPADGTGRPVALGERVRAATPDDVANIGALELEISGIRREGDYRFCIENPLGCLHASVMEDARGNLAGFAVSIRHKAINMLGPAFARTEDEMLALMQHELERFRGASVLAVVPMENRRLVEALYRWGGVNVETHLLQVRGKFQPIAGVNLPSFLPETG